MKILREKGEEKPKEESKAGRGKKEKEQNGMETKCNLITVTQKKNFNSFKRS